MPSTTFTFTSKVWLYPGQTAWHFVTLPKKESAGIKALFHGISSGFGSLPVTVSIGATTWKTSIFPDTKVGAYLLPLKKKVRKAEQFEAGDTITYSIEILV